MDKITLIEKAIAKAENCESKLDEGCFDVGGFISPKIRHLLNNLGAISTKYFEIGCHRGSSTVSALYKNNDNLRGVIVDNWTEFNSDNSVRDEFFENIKKYNLNIHTVYEKDCFDLTKAEVIPADFYLYDGGHGYEEQVKAITHFFDYLADEFILCVDDYDWNDVSRGTQDGLKKVNANVVFEKHLKGSDGYHNGFYVALIVKQ